MISPRVTAAAREAARAGTTTSAEPAPDFVLRDVRGPQIRLFTLLERGRVVLVFYRGGWCPICNVQLGRLSAAYDQFAERGVEIVAISNDVVRKGKEALESVGPKYPVVVDPESEVITAYGAVVSRRDPLVWVLGKQAYAHPMVLIVERDGRVSWAYRGANYRDRPSVARILAALDAVSPGRP